jgi:trehalose 6-phosphate phosphatase
MKRLRRRHGVGRRARLSSRTRSTAAESAGVKDPTADHQPYRNLAAIPLTTDGIGLFLDVDGTLLDYAETPDAVSTPAPLVDTLHRLEERLDGALALVSGRPIVDLDKLFAPLRLRVSGVHGAEFRGEPDQAWSTPAGAVPAHAAWSELVALLTGFSGVFGENKGASFAVHYRCEPAERIRLMHMIDEFIARHSSLGLRRSSGHRVIEVMLPGFDKGRAIARFMARAPFAGRRTVFVGDDEVDRPGCDVAQALGGLSFSVGREMAGVSGWFSGPAGVRTWLAALCR